MQNLGLKVGLVADNKLIYVATILDPIDSGLTSLNGSFSELEIDRFLNLFKSEIKATQHR
jgi:hypothetical protein